MRRLQLHSPAELKRGAHTFAHTASGVHKVVGTFEAEDAVWLRTISGVAIGIGIANYSSADIALLQKARMHSAYNASVLGYASGQSQIVSSRNMAILTWQPDNALPPPPAGSTLASRSTSELSDDQGYSSPTPTLVNSKRCS